MKIFDFQGPKKSKIFGTQKNFVFQAHFESHKNSKAFYITQSRINLRHAEKQVFPESF